MENAITREELIARNEFYIKTAEDQNKLIIRQREFINTLQEDVNSVYALYNSLDEFAKATAAENLDALTFLRERIKKIKQSKRNNFTEMLLSEYNVLIKKLGGLDSE